MADTKRRSRTKEEQAFIDEFLAGLDEKSRKVVESALNDPVLTAQVEESRRLEAACDPGVPLSEVKRRLGLV